MGGPPSGSPYGSMTPGMGPMSPQGGSPDGPGAAAGPQKPALPEDVSKWVRDDYYRAKEEGNPRLAEAVAYLGKKYAGVTEGGKNEKAAVLLTRLLKAEAPNAPAGGAPAGPSPGTGYPGGSSGMMSGGYPGGMSGGRPMGMAPAGPSGGSSMGMMGSSGGPPMGMGMMGSSGGMGPMGMGAMGMSGGYGASGAAAAYRPLDEATIKAIIHALAVNGSRPARQTIGEVLDGSFKSDGDRSATEGVLETLVMLPSPENEELMMRVLLNPEQIRPTPRGQAQPSTPGPTGMAGSMPRPMGMGSSMPMMPGSMQGSGGYAGMMGSGSGPYGGYGGSGQGKMTAAEMRTRLIALLEQFASDPVRIKLANLVVAATTPNEVRQALTPMLTAVYPQNLPAQKILYRSDVLDRGGKTALEYYFGRYSSSALAALLNVPEALPAPRSSGRTGYMGAGAGAGMMPGMMVGMPNAPGSRPMMGPAAGPPGMPPGPGQGIMPMGMSDPDAAGSRPGMMPANAPMGMMYPGAPSGMMGSSPYGGNRSAGTPNATLALKGDALYAMASSLWSEEFTETIGARLGAIESLEHDAPSLVLASTVPTDAVRAKLYEALHRHRDEGPLALENAGLSGDTLSDPGFVVVLKSLPRKDSAAKASRPSLSRLREMRSRQGPNNSRGEQQPGQGYQPQQQEQPKPADEWLVASERFVRAMSARLVVAGKRGAKSSASLAELRPVDVPRDVGILAEYHLDWPEGLPAKDKLSGVSLDPMTVHYLRFQTTSTPAKIITYYRGKLSRPQEHAGSTGIWLESLRKLPDTGRRLSIDVLITKEADLDRASATGRTGAGYGMMPGQPGGPMAMSGSDGPPQAGRFNDSRYGGRPGDRTDRERNQPTELVIEILAVEINDPTRSGEEEKT